jgi:DNA primase
MRYRGREIDPLELWSRYVEFPPGMDEQGPFLPKVVCPNPEHDTLKSHFQVNISQPTVHCFARCGISGSYEHAISIIEGCDEREARRIILRESVRPGLRAVVGAVSAPTVAAPAVRDLAYDRFLPQAGLEYLSGRGITEKSVSTWELGWDSEELRIVIPALDENRHIRFLIKRATKPRDEPKYLYTEGVPKSSLLFGACNLDMGMVSSLGLILTEGSLDVIRLHQLGLRNAVAILGTGISKAQRNIVARMRPSRIYFMFDKDLAGITNIEIAARMLRKYPCFVCRYPKGVSDPGEISHEAAERSIKRAIPIVKFMSDNFPNVETQRRRKFGYASQS